MRTRPPSRVVCSTMTTASAPAGIGAPVMISTAWPGATAPSKLLAGPHLADHLEGGRQIDRAQRAYPSRTERASAG